MQKQTVRVEALEKYRLEMGIFFLQNALKRLCALQNPSNVCMLTFQWFTMDIPLCRTHSPNPLNLLLIQVHDPNSSFHIQVNPVLSETSLT